MFKIFKSILLTTALLLIFHHAFPQSIMTCPTPEQVKKMQFNFSVWQGAYINTGEIINNFDLSQLTTHTYRFKLAEFMLGAPEGENHCYYSNDNDEWSNFYLTTKQKALPSGNNWHKLNKDIQQCSLSIENCTWE